MASDRIARILSEDEGDDVSDEDEGKAVVEPGGVADGLRRYRQLILQVMLTRGVDNFLSFVTELLSTVFRTRPETLRSGEQVRVDFVLEQPSMEDLINRLAERRVEGLSFAGMRALQEGLEKQLGFELFEDDDRLRRAVRIVETRNLIVHNRAIVNRRYLARVTHEKDPAVGDVLKLWAEEVFLDLGFLGEAVASIDGRASAKWGLEQPVIEWP